MNQSTIDRTFKLWDYHTSHNHLLLRSPKSPDSNHTPPANTNIDIRFFGVSYLNIPTLLRGCEIVEANVEKINTIDSLFPNRTAENKIFIIVSAGSRYLVVAVGYEISENDLDIFQTILDRYNL
ncbi:hypothetical protein [Chamaesiphon polymorphus]|uniref:Uncharacterized protein n=1 Tax=Chamaesiphon polymorphus CCALA 037 TaxID=2107692 RepID=A0A2T1GNH3_9CYAN|nr:hypothetical protein [Chamaesiphon polymorphus]PSB59463.1 hypothetical protein C7B77_00730 [Chamaesiphon polymorphus CCALA 037]